MRLVTYNIHKGIGGRDRRYELARVVEVIEHLKPDFVFLQEVDLNVRRSQFDDQPKKLVGHFEGFHRAFQRNVTLTTGGYGNLVLSRWPFERRHSVSLRLAQKKPRGALLTVVRTPQGPLHLVNSHLGLAEAERHWQMNHLLTHRLFLASTRLPTLLAGDFNDWRNTLERNILARHGFQQVTSPPSRFRSFPAYLPIGSLDKAFVRGSIEVTGAHISWTKLARRASDHLPLVVEFELRPC